MPRIINGRSVSITPSLSIYSLTALAAHDALPAARVRPELQKSADTAFMGTTMMPLRKAPTYSTEHAPIGPATRVDAMPAVALPSPAGALPSPVAPREAHSSLAFETKPMVDAPSPAPPAHPAAPASVAHGAPVVEAPHAPAVGTKKRRRESHKQRRRRLKNHELRYIDSHDDEEFEATGRHMYSVMWVEGGLGPWTWDVECLFPGVGMRHPLIVEYHRAHPLRRLDERRRAATVVRMRRSDDQNRASDAAIRRWVADTTEPRSRHEQPACYVIAHVMNETCEDVFYGRDCVGPGSAPRANEHAAGAVLRRDAHA